jgi:hypothetical protein
VIKVPIISNGIGLYHNPKFLLSQKMTHKETYFLWIRLAVNIVLNEVYKIQRFRAL